MPTFNTVLAMVGTLRFAHPTAPSETLQRLLLVAAILARELHAARTALGGKPVRRAAFAAHRFNARIALFDHEVALFHGFADQPFGLFPHRLFRHSN